MLLKKQKIQGRDVHVLTTCDRCDRVSYVCLFVVCVEFVATDDSSEVWGIVLTDAWIVLIPAVWHWKRAILGGFLDLI